MQVKQSWCLEFTARRSMWRGSEQEGLNIDGNYLQPPHQQPPRNTHDALFVHQSPAVSEQQISERMQAQLSGQLNSNLTQSLPPALLAEAAQGQAADLPNMQLDLDNATLSAALGLGDNFLAQFQRSIGDQHAQSSSDFSAILAASLGVLPVSKQTDAAVQTCLCIQ